MRKITIALTVLVAVAAMALPNAGASAAGGASKADTSWLAGAMQTDLFEIQAGETAAREGRSQDAVRLGERLSRAHAHLLAAGEELGAKIGVRPPSEPSRLQQGLLQKLDSTSGKEFDLTYAEEMITGHLESIAKAKAEIAKGTNQAVKAAARSDLTMHLMHLRLARQLKAGL